MKYAFIYVGTNWL